MKKNVRIFRLLALLLILCAFAAGCASQNKLTKDHVWKRLQAAVEEFNSRTYYQVTCQTQIHYGDDKADEVMVYEHIRHGSNQYTSTTIGSEYSNFELRYDGALYCRCSNNLWYESEVYSNVTSIVVALPDAAHEILAWTESDGGLVVECSMPGDTKETIVYYIDPDDRLVKTVDYRSVSEENGGYHTQTQTMTVGVPSENWVLMYLQQAYEAAKQDTALPTEPPTVLEPGDLLIRYVAAGSSAYRDEAYYVFRGGELIEISVETVNKYAPEAVYVWPDSQISDADEALTASQWQVSLLYVPETSQFGDGENWLPTRFGEHWRIYYNHEPYDMEPSDYFLSILPEIVYDFHNGDLDGIAGARTLAYFTIVNTNDGFLVEYLDNLYLWNGSSKLLMEGSRDSGCQYDYYTVITP